MKNKVLLWHTLFWIVFTAMFTFIEGGYNHNFDEAFALELSYLPIRLVIVYFNYFYLLPTFLLKKKVRKYILYSLLTVIAMALLQRALNYYVYNPLIFPDWTQKGLFEIYRTAQAAMLLIFPMIFLIGLTTIFQWADSEHRVQELAKEKLETELKYLKNQVNPHFFFNILNNLYGLAQEKSDRTPEVVLKLSELMSYMLYETNRNLIDLEKELEYIKNYISLEEQRYGDRFTCNLSVKGDLSHVKIPPMLILPFIENSFKHGINVESKGAWMNIALSVESDLFLLEVTNSLATKVEDKPKSKGGFGIKNVERRLQLLYPDGYELKSGQVDDAYTVVLKLELNKFNHTEDAS